jgi:hypothetical protein
MLTAGPGVVTSGEESFSSAMLQRILHARQQAGRS